MMNRNEFFIYLAENVQMYLPPSFEDAQVSIEENIKAVQCASSLHRSCLQASGSCIRKTMDY